MSKAHCLLVALALAGFQVHAQSVQDRMAVMDAQLELLKKQGQLDEALQKSAGSAVTALPQVLAVMGLDGVQTVRLQLANGVVNTYRVGETIRPGMSVLSVTPRQVSVAVSGGKTARAVPLEFVAGASSPGQANFAPLPGGRPPVPRELLPEPPAVRMPAPGMPAAAVQGAAPIAASPAAPAASPPVAAPSAIVAAPASLKR